VEGKYAWHNASACNDIPRLQLADAVGCDQILTCAPVALAAAKMRSGRRYDSAAGGGPKNTASSAYAFTRIENRVQG